MIHDFHIISIHKYIKFIKFIIIIIIFLIIKDKTHTELINVRALATITIADRAYIDRGNVFVVLDQLLASIDCKICWKRDLVLTMWSAAAAPHRLCHIVVNSAFNFLALMK